MTLSSVNSVAVSPNPLLLFNLHLPSYTSTALHQTGWMALHVMPPTKKSASLGRKFASGIKRDPSHFEVSPDDGEFHEMTTPFSAFSEYTFHRTASGVHVPILDELEVAFVCAKKAVYEVENHEIWVVSVDDILYPNKSITSPSGGLLYFDRGFRTIGSNLSE